MRFTAIENVRHAAGRRISQVVGESAGALPEVNLTHMRTMTDDTGILQHAKYSVPDRTHGYCVDDNSRALVVSCMHYSLFQDKGIIPRLQTYLSFLHHSLNPQNGRFRNFMSYDRRWLEDKGSEDSHGRVLRGLGAAVKRAPNASIRSMAVWLFASGLGAVEGFTSPRAWAFTIVGLHDFLEIYEDEPNARRVQIDLAERLLRLFDHGGSPDWLWCEGTLTYANAKLSHALILAGRQLANPKMLSTGIKSLEWLLDRQTAPAGHLSIVGNGGWHTREGLAAKFDQQPIEAQCLTEACAEAFLSSGEERWVWRAHVCLSWFLGNNDLAVPMCDLETGASFDGLQADGVNENQGAESTLSWLISLLTLHELAGQKGVTRNAGGPGCAPTAARCGVASRSAAPG